MWIAAMGHFHPKNTISNDFFSKLNIGSDAAWVESRTGIKQRHAVISEDEIIALQSGQETLQTLRDANRIMPIAHLANNAWKNLLAQSSESLPNPDLLICGTSIPDYDIPANACTIAAKLKLSIAAFDVNSACSSFVVNLHVARGLIANGCHECIAIFNPERYSLRINYHDRSSAVLFGDGCAASLVTSHKPKGLALKLLDTLIQSDPAKFAKVAIKDGGTFAQDGAAVQKFAITRTIEATRQILARNGLQPQDLQYFAGHQANLRMVESAAAKLGIPAEKHLFNVDHYGNQGAAGAPCVLAMNWEKFRPGDKIAVAVVGSGLTWGAALFECA